MPVLRKRGLWPWKANCLPNVNQGKWKRQRSEKQHKMQEGIQMRTSICSQFHTASGKPRNNLIPRWRKRERDRNRDRECVRGSNFLQRSKYWLANTSETKPLNFWRKIISSLSILLICMQRSTYIAFFITTNSRNPRFQRSNQLLHFSGSPVPNAAFPGPRLPITQSTKCLLSISYEPSPGLGTRDMGWTWQHKVSARLDVTVQ